MHHHQRTHSQRMNPKNHNSSEGVTPKKMWSSQMKNLGHHLHLLGLWNLYLLHAVRWEMLVIHLD